MNRTIPRRISWKALRRLLGVRKIELVGFYRFFLSRLRPKAKPPKSPSPFLGAQAQSRQTPVKGKAKSIAEVSRLKCMGCGLCFSACPASAIVMSRDELSFVPIWNEANCTQCGKCYAACPGINVLSYPGTLGSIQKMYVTHAKDPIVRHEASSGGTCRAILMALLENRVVDKVIVTRATQDPYTPETIISSCLDDLIGDRLNSIYSPTSPLCSLKDLDKSAKYAIVGLPCHIAGLSLAQGLKKNIYLSIGIFCSHMPSFQFVDEFLRDLSCDEEVERLAYRGNGWPGKSTVYFKDGDAHGFWFPSLWHKYNEQKSFQLPRCRACTYYSGEFADISIGDPWSLVRQDKVGSSLVFVRTSRGMDCMDIAGKRIDSYEVAPEHRRSILAFHEDSAASKRASARGVSPP